VPIISVANLMGLTAEAVEDWLQSPRDGSERVAVAILGGSHDLTDASDRQKRGRGRIPGRVCASVQRTGGVKLAGPCSKTCVVCRTNGTSLRTPFSHNPLQVIKLH
jgi:hypothetical protein